MIYLKGQPQVQKAGAREPLKKASKQARIQPLEAGLLLSKGVEAASDETYLFVCLW